MTDDPTDDPTDVLWADPPATDPATTPTVPLLPLSQLEAVVTTFYDLVYAHPWLGKFFAAVDQPNQETKLVRFLQMAWDDQAYPQMQAQYLQREHAHMYITDELFDLRQELLAEALRQHGHPPPIIGAMLAFNERWRDAVVKTSIEQCSDMFTPVVAHPRPR